MDFLNENSTAILVAVIGVIPGIFAFWNSQRTKKSLELMGSSVTVDNWNKLIKNLYAEIDRLNLELTRERQEKNELLDQVADLRRRLEDFEVKLKKSIESGDALNKRMDGHL